MLFFVAKEGSMNILKRIFNTKETPDGKNVVRKGATQTAHSGDDKGKPASATDVDYSRRLQILSMFDGLTHPSVVSNNFITLFKTVPEVFWPINYIAKRISEAHFDLKRMKDDSLVWCNRLGADEILKRPNPIMTWRELVYMHMVYKMADGNAYFRAAIPEGFSADVIKFQYCSNYWSLPSDYVDIEPANQRLGLPIFGVADIDDIIKGYKINAGDYSRQLIPACQIWHDRDGLPELVHGTNFMKSNSRLLSLKQPISNLIAVYEARNIIYVKHGAVGFIVAQKEDPTGTVALEPSEKDELRKEINGKHGIIDNRSPWAITDIPVSFVRTNLSISELQPFEETLADAIAIAGQYGIPAVLVPRKDQSTFSNQDAAEKSVYTSVIIPETKRFCEAITIFLGLDQKGLYLDCDFSDVACLQTGLKDGEEVKKLTNERCLSQFNNGVISINTWRAQIHEDSLEGEVFDKTKFEMTPEELAFVDSVIKAQASPIQITTGSDQNQQTNQPNNKPSKGERNERTDD